MLTGERTVRRTCPCGWSGRYTTDGYANKAQRAHSCGVDWSPKPCTHGGIHRHGTRACHVHCGCKCESCRVATAEAEQAMARARAYSRSRFVDATAAREHVLRLVEEGVGVPRIARLAGLHRDTVERLIRRKWRGGHWETSARIARATESALLAVTYDPADGSPPIDGAATTRRLRSLVALGWWPSLLAREAGYEQAYLDRLICGRKVRPGTARRVHALYRRLADAEPPTGTYADRARRMAAERGWMPPLRVGGRVVAGRPIDEPERGKRVA